MNSIEEQILFWKQKRNAVILAHNYQPGPIQDIADFVGDSLGLSIQASKTEADVIVFCGVLFMAETAAILSPEKTVLLPDITAGCPMADMITARQLEELRRKHPDALVVCYVNSSAEVKALSDYCCTSSNAVPLVNRLPSERPILFVPDQHLGQFTAERTGRSLILWPGYCPTHLRITAEEIRAARRKYPGALVLAHPECGPEVRRLADELLSTGGMIRFAGQSRAESFLIATEEGILHTLRKKYPEKTFAAVSEFSVCPNMKKITLEKVLWSLQERQVRVEVPEPTAQKARKALERMMEILPES
ncbi:MAG TPA: quinolinate synthase NadA [Anaerohalosphaeraceae bacterium]|nr:quinolinate synthase NadA [Anaerohalosphaeraceae bacterium]HOT72582.1 quinolinate synthase NadA [Anaerohalosphaeraceae bacterium]HQG05759.1 quinolinate synthase NadA [Anaerohalosphaeraceae bacterium]HQI07132.1 quinolinate synthase NadA [Anaerohalosphaeraceae bacterium]HQJ66938.1 quinolinate synthase NadA [Anaerohalosphaeraceae bacterium]